MLNHLYNGFYSLPLFAKALRISMMILDLGRCIRTIAKLILEPDYAKSCIALTIRRPAWNDKAGKTFICVG